MEFELALEGLARPLVVRMPDSMSRWVVEYALRDAFVCVARMKKKAIREDGLLNEGQDLSADGSRCPRT